MPSATSIPPNQVSYWSYMRRRWERNAGLRLDFLLLSPQCAARLKDADVDRWVRSEQGASDHAPVWIELCDTNLNEETAEHKKAYHAQTLVALYEGPQGVLVTWSTGGRTDGDCAKPH